MNLREFLRRGHAAQRDVDEITGRRIFKARYRRLGGHVHARIFSAQRFRDCEDLNFALLGDLTFDLEDWASFKEQTRGWILVDEGIVDDDEGA